MLSVRGSALVLCSCSRAHQRRIWTASASFLRLLRPRSTPTRAYPRQLHAQAPSAHGWTAHGAQVLHSRSAHGYPLELVYRRSLSSLLPTPFSRQLYTQSSLTVHAAAPTSCVNRLMLDLPRSETGTHVHLRDGFRGRDARSSPVHVLDRYGHAHQPCLWHEHHFSLCDSASTGAIA